MLVLVLAGDHVADALSHHPSLSLQPPAHSSWPPAALPFPPSPVVYYVFPWSGASLPLTVAAAPQQRVVELGCCADTGTQAAKVGVVLPAVHEVAVCSLSDAPPQSDPRGVLDCQGLHRCEGGGYLGIPDHEEGKGFIVNSAIILENFWYMVCANQGKKSMKYFTSRLIILTNLLAYFSHTVSQCS